MHNNSDIVGLTIEIHTYGQHLNWFITSITLMDQYEGEYEPECPLEFSFRPDETAGTLLRVNSSIWVYSWIYLVMSCIYMDTWCVQVAPRWDNGHRISIPLYCTRKQALDECVHFRLFNELVRLLNAVSILKEK